MPPRKNKVEKASVGLAADELTGKKPPANVAALAEQVAADGGEALATYRDPFGEHWLVLAALPIDKVEPTPFQRQLSDAHVKKLIAVIPKVERFLDPLIAIKAPDADTGYWTPNGMHRLEAMKRLGAKAVTVLLVPEIDVAYRILALNTEKAHNLKDKSLEVVRMAAALAEDDVAGKLPERNWEFEFEEPAYLTIGKCYEQNARYSGGAYMPVVRRCEDFFDEPIADCIEVRQARAEKLLELDAAVADCVKALKEAGLQSSYLKPFVVARINPLRFVKTKRGQTGPIAEFDETIKKMMDKAAKFDAAKIKPQDLARAAGAPSD